MFFSMNHLKSDPLTFQNTKSENDPRLVTSPLYPDSIL